MHHNKELNIYLWLYGGYGDCLAAYLNGGRGQYNKRIPGKNGKGSINWTILTALKKSFPEVHTRAIVISGNPQSKLLAQNNPYIDTVIATPTLYQVNIVNQRVRKLIENNSVKFTDIDTSKLINSISEESKTNSIYLSSKDTKQLRSIQRQTDNRFIVIHPFASIANRAIIPAREYIEIARQTYSELGIKTIFLGSSYIRTSKQRNNTIAKVYCKEELDTERYPEIINLIGKGSLLLGSQLVMNSIMVIGTWSCHTTCALAINKPSIIFTTKAAMQHLKPISEQNFNSALPDNRTYIAKHITSKVITGIMEHVKRYV